MNEQDDSGAAGTVRRAQPQDVDSILDLLTEYELPRAYFEPFYLADPTYTPDQSWLVEHNGQVAAHLRQFDRWLRMHETTLHVVGVGNVITARAFRGQGHAGRLIQAMTAAATRERFPYSILWTHLPTLYERYGWAAIEQQTINALLSEVASHAATIRPFRSGDLAEVIRIYETTNQNRTGPTVRTPDYWRAQLAWLASGDGEFLVARTQDDSMGGYVRSLASHSEVKILELGLPAEHADLGRALVARAAQRRGNHVQARLPPSLFDVIPDSERDIEDDSHFMGRILSLDSLVETLTPVLLRRARAAGLTNAAFSLATGSGSVDVRLADEQVTLDPGGTRDPLACITEGEFAHLLFHGFDRLGAELLDGRPEAAVLRVLFPAQDFVIWPADAF